MTRAARRAGGLLALAAALSPGAASAHLVGVEFGDFYAGALHAGTGVGYVGALLALSLLAGLQPRQSGRWALVAAPPGLLCGALAASFAFIGPAAPMETGVIAALALCGVLAALNARPGQSGLALLAALVGFVLGAANGQALGEQALSGAPVGGVAISPWLFSLGVTTAGAMAVILGVAAMRAAADKVPVLALVWRVAGSWLAAAGAAWLALMAAQAGAV